MAVRSTPDILAGLVFIAFAIAFVVFGNDLPFGTPRRMGPGFFPVILAGILAVLGVATVLKGLGRGSGAEDRERVGTLPWRRIGLLTGAVAVFGATVEGLGLGPALAFALLMAAMADPAIRWKPALLAIAGIVLFSWLVFVRALGLPLPFFGRWLLP